MANERSVPNNTVRNKKKIVGVILMVIGIGGFIFSYILFFLEVGVSYGSDFGYYLGHYIGLVLLVLSFLLAVLGGIVFLVGDNEERRRRKHPTAGDSQSDYNKAIKKS